MISTIRTMPQKYDLIGEDDFSHFLELLGMDYYKKQYSAGFALINDGEIIELWGFVGIVPYLSKLVTRLYYAPINDEISHSFHAIGELAKTKKFPKQYATFERRVSQWIRENNPPISRNDIERFIVIAAYNCGWITKHALIHWHGISADSLWLER